ncbi:MAG: hypothetical protein AB8B79_10930 [Granulosicoccus sp.]
MKLLQHAGDDFREKLALTPQNQEFHMDVNTRGPGCDVPRSFIVRNGFDARADDAKFIQRLKCKRCAKKFSAATFSAT